LDVILIVTALFSAVSTSFIIYIHPQLQADSGDETTALLRVIIYKLDPTAFGGSAPTIPQWAGPSGTVTRVQLLLYLSLVFQVVTVLLAVLAKRVVHLYALRTIWRSEEEKKKVEQKKEEDKKKGKKEEDKEKWLRRSIRGLVFMLPLMLELSLALLGVAATIYLWKLEIAISAIIIAAIGCYFPIFLISFSVGVDNTGLVGGLWRK